MKTISFSNYLFRDETTNQHSSHLTALVNGLRFDSKKYVALFSITLTNNIPATLKVPLNKFGYHIITRLINTNLRSPVTIDLHDNISYVFQNNEPIQPARIDVSTTQHQFALDSLQYLLDR